VSCCSLVVFQGFGLGGGRRWWFACSDFSFFHYPLSSSCLLSLFLFSTLSSDPHFSFPLFEGLAWTSFELSSNGVCNRYSQDLHHVNRQNVALCSRSESEPFACIGLQISCTQMYLRRSTLEKCISSVGKYMSPSFCQKTLLRIVIHTYIRAILTTQHSLTSRWVRLYLAVVMSMNKHS